MSVLSILWQIATSRIGIALIAGTLAYGYGYQRGHDAADRSAEIAALVSRIAVKEADINIARNAGRIAAAQAEQMAEITLQQQEHLDDLESELASRPERAACRLTGHDIERLLDIDAGEGGGAARPAPLSILPPARERAGTTGR